MADLKLKILLDAADRISAPFRRASQSTDHLKSALQDAAAKMSGLERASKDLAAYRKLRDDAKATAIALKEAKEKAAQLGKALAESGGGSKKAQKEFQAARNAVNRLQEVMQAQTAKAGHLRQGLDKAGVTTESFGRKIKDLTGSEGMLSAAQRKLKRDIDATRSAMEAARAKTEALAKARAKLSATKELQGRMAANGAIGMATGGGALALESRMAMDGISFDEQMSAVGAISRLDKTSAEFAKLRDMAKDLGATTSFSASQAAQGLQYLSMAGFDANQMLAAMPGVLDLAKAGATDLGQASDIASNILSGFGLQASEMGRVGDTLVATFTRSNVNLAMLGDTMKYTAPIARQFGASIEDVSAMSGLLGNVGIQGSEAGTALRALFTRMAAPPKAAREALEQLGVATRDAAGNMRPMTDILADVAQKTEKMGAGARIGIFTDIAGMEAGSAMAELVGQGGAGAITKFTDVLKGANGEAARVAKQMGDNAAGDIKGFSSAVEGLNIALTETNDAPLRSLIQSATGIVRGITGWVNANPILADTLVKVAVGVSALVAVGGVLSITIASVLGPFAIVRFALSALRTNGIGASGALTTLGSRMTKIGTGAGIMNQGLASNLARLRQVEAAANSAARAESRLSSGRSRIKMGGKMLGGAGLALSAGMAASDLFDSSLSKEEKGASVGNLTGGLGGAAIGAALGSAFPVIGTAIGAIVGGMLGSFGGDMLGGWLAKDKPKIPIAPPPSSAAAALIGLGGQSPQDPAPQVNMGGVTIVVHAAPGQSETEIAKVVKAELEKVERQKRTDARSRLYDGEK